MSKKVTLGGERLGSGKKMTASMKGYGKSHHNLSYVWKSSMTTGTLVPFMVEPMLNGDKATINLDTIVRTHPTIGAMFGSFKLQLDVFKCPIRHWHSALHQNKKGIGMHMENIKLPIMKIQGRSITINEEQPNITKKTAEQDQINTSSLLHYLGISGLGYTNQLASTPVATRRFNALPLLMYWDIYANYYANLQEGVGKVIGSQTTGYARIEEITWHAGNGTTSNVTNYMTQLAIDEYHIAYIPLSRNSYITIQGNGISPKNILLTLQRHNEEPYTTSIESWLTSFPNTIEYNGTNTFATIRGAIDTSQSTLNIINDMEHIGIAIQNTETIINNELEIQTFDIKNIDEMKESILASSPSAIFTIDENANKPYKFTTGTITGTGGLDSLSKGTMAGLGLKTYQSDRFNNWLSTEWIDGTNGINEITAIDVSDGTLRMDALNLQQKIYNVLNRIAISGGSYRDWQEAVYAHRGHGEIEIPEWMGGASSEILFDEVISTAGAEQEPLGSLGGRGRQSEIKKHEINILATEPLYIIGIISITPRLDYGQGNRWFNRIRTMDEWHKPELDGIGFQDLLTDEFSAANTLAEPNTTAYNAIGKQLAWTEYTTNVNQCHGNFVSGNPEAFMCLNRTYETNLQTGLSNYTTYIDPTLFNTNFATTDLSAQHFWLQIGVHLMMERVMSTHQIPQL